MRVFAVVSGVPFLLIHLFLDNKTMLNVWMPTINTPGNGMRQRKQNTITEITATTMKLEHTANIYTPQNRTCMICLKMDFRVLCLCNSVRYASQYLPYVLIYDTHAFQQPPRGISS